MPPTLSILVPTYNRQATLKEAVLSALRQTYREVEVVICDDASTDGTPEVARSLTRLDDRVRYLRHERNLGIAGNWRAGIGAARGEYFCLLHDDDTLEPEFAAELLEPLASNADLILSFSDHWLMNETGVRLPAESTETSNRFRRSSLPGGRVEDFATTGLVDHSIPIGASIFRRVSIDPNSLVDKAAGASDMWLVYQCVRTGMNAWYVPRRLMNYRSHGGGMSSSAPLAMASGHAFRYEEILRDDGMRSIHPAVRQRLSQVRVDLALALVAAGRHKEARAASVTAFKSQPGGRSLAAIGLAFSGAIGSTAIQRWRSRGRRTIGSVQERGCG